MKAVHLNDIITVKLKDRGLEILQKEENKIYERIRKEGYLFTRDAEGNIQFEFHSFINFFKDVNKDEELFFPEIKINNEILKVDMHTKVKVKLTKAGLAILIEYLIIHSTNGGKMVLPEMDANGCTEFELWEIMHIFGAKVRPGQINLPFELKIKIDDKPLKKNQKVKNKQMLLYK
ncbi:MAG: hypothetical protein PHN72_05420 [Bacilli bacterium]|nr:hypothetical protein [Bacilli bacterium]